MLIHFLRLTIRGFRKNRLYTWLNTIGFAVGFAVVLTIILFISTELTVDRSFKDYNRTYRLISAREDNCWINYEVAEQIRNNYPEVEMASPVQYMLGYSVALESDRHFAKRDQVIATDNVFFKIFGLSLIDGYSDEPFSESNSVAITQSLAHEMFDNEDPLGRTIHIGGFFEGRITGVVADFPENTSFSSDIFLNIENERFRIIQSSNDGIMMYPANIYLTLLPGSDPDQLETKLQNKGDLASGPEEGTWLQSLSSIYFSEGIENNVNRTVNRPMLRIFTGIATLILLLSVFNHINFSFSLQFAKLRATGIKKAYGAGFGQLAAFHITETSVGILVAFGISLVVLLLTLPMTSSLFDRNFDPKILLDFPVLSFMLLLIVLLIVISTYAALYLISRFDIRKVLSREAIKTKGGRLNHILSVAQATVSIILIIGVFTIYKQLSYVKHTDLGFNKEHLIRIYLPGDFTRGSLVKQELGDLPFVTSSSLSLGTAGMINMSSGSQMEEKNFNVNLIAADRDFIKTFGLQLLSGRNFLEGDIDRACIVNQETMAQYGWDDIEGKRFENYGGFDVIGEVNDFHVSSMHNAIEPLVLIFRENACNTLSLRLASGNISQQLAQLEEAWMDVMPDQQFDFVFYDDYFNSLYRSEERLGSAIAIFSALAFLITLMGMAGLIFQNCLNRSKEIGIRKVNGAMISEVMFMLNKDFVIWVVVAFFIASPIAWFVMVQWLQNFAYRTSLSWWIFALTGLLALGIALLTVSWQSYRAASRNPVEALRYE